MKMKYLLIMLSVLILPVSIFAVDYKSLETRCDERIFDAMYEKYINRDDNAPQLTYMLRRNTKENMEALLKYCNSTNCEIAKFGQVLVGDKRTISMNMLTLSFLFNNKEVAEYLMEHKPEMKYLIDNGIYEKDTDWSNGQFVTPAINAIKEGQPGVIRYLTRKHNANLFKTAGRKYLLDPSVPLPNGLEIAEKQIKQWRDKTPDPERLKCAELVLNVVKEWYAENKNNQKMLKEAEAYNKKLDKVASSKDKYMTENITPFDFTPSMDIFKLQNIEENFTKNIDKQIDILIEKIMHDFDFSAFENQI